MRYFRKGGISNGSTPFLRTVEAASYRTEHDPKAGCIADRCDPRHTKEEEEIPPVTAIDNDISVFEEEQDKQPVQETDAEEDSVVDSPASDVDNDIETSELPIEDEATTEAVQPEQEEKTAPVMIDKGEERSAPLGIIITAVTLLSASGAIWFIKRKR